MGRKYCILAGGCFWCMARPFYETKGILEIYSGYSGGTKINPTYKEVKAQETNHFEVVKVVYDDEIISYNDVLDIYFNTIDPFDDEGQFIDRGHSYSPALFYQDELMYKIIIAVINNYEEKFKQQIKVKVLEEMPFYLAEEEHQDYCIKNPDLMEEELILSGRKK